MNIFAPWLFDGVTLRRSVELCWEEGRIVSVQESDPPANLQDHFLVLPGFINLHTHLELSDCEGLLPRLQPFPQWVGALRKQTASWDEARFVDSWLRGAKQCLRCGTTTVLDTGNSLVNFKLVGQLPLRIWAMQELMGLEYTIAMDRCNIALQEASHYSPSTVLEGGRGFCVHAPYSSHPALFHRVALHAQEFGYLWSVHVAESREEAELYEKGEGLFKQWLDTFSPQHCFRNPLPAGILRELESWIPGPLPLLVHGNTLNAQELRRLSELRSALVHCPQSARWFGHPPLDLPLCIELGISLCLGTDSLASADSLSLWDQLALVHLQYPQIDPLRLFSWVSSVPGSLLGNGLGTIQPGAPADFIVVKLPQDEVCWEWLLQGTPPLHAIYVRGQDCTQGVL